MAFKDEKKKVLSRVDNSRKGDIDKEIRKLVDEINSKKSYYTTSSCAGRTVLLEKNGFKKNGSIWLYETHKKADFDKINIAIKATRTENDVWIKQESAILHICSETIEDADKICKIANFVGFKRAGIICISPNIMAEIFGNEKVEVRIMRNGKILVDEEFLKEIVCECNEKMQRNKVKLQKLLDAVTNI